MENAQVAVYLAYVARAGTPAAWAAADEVYRADPGLRDELARRGLG